MNEVNENRCRVLPVSGISCKALASDRLRWQLHWSVPLLVLLLAQLLWGMAQTIRAAVRAVEITRIERLIEKQNFKQAKVQIEAL